MRPSGILTFWAFASLLVSGEAFAHANGIYGYSGKNGGSICTACHNGGAAPTITVTGPASLTFGQKALYTVAITGGASSSAGLDATLGGLAGATLGASAADNTQLMSGEITHNQAGLFVNGTSSFSFNITAPSTAGTLTVYVAGLSANGNGGDTGDGANKTSFDIAVSTNGGTGGGSATGGGAGGGTGGGGSATGGGSGSGGGAGGGSGGGSATGGGVGTSTGGGSGSGGGSAAGGGSATGGGAGTGGGGVVMTPPPQPGGAQSLTGGGVVEGVGCDTTKGAPSEIFLALVALWMVMRSKRRVPVSASSTSAGAARNS